MSREQRIALFFFACILLFGAVYAVAGHWWPDHRFTMALMTATIVWSGGISLLFAQSAWLGRRVVVEDERDRRLSLQATFIGGAAGYLALFFGITIIHLRYTMNGQYILPIDAVYGLFALIVFTFGAVRELTVLVLYRTGDHF